MPIRVTCPKCHTRFNVSEKFAGKEGPCPKCKAKIRVPDKSEEVVIHAPVEGPKDSQGRAILKPIRRKETRLSSIQITLIVVSVVGFLLACLMVRFFVGGNGEAGISPWIIGLVAILVAPPTVYVAYTFLRDSERAAFQGKELWIRVAVASLIYAALWLWMPLGKYAFNGYEMGAWMMAIVPMLAIGGAVGMGAFEFDYLLGVVHYGFYLGVCLLGRTIAGLGVFPGMMGDGKPNPFRDPPPAAELMQTWDQIVALLSSFFGG